MLVKRASPPNFQEWRWPSRLNVSATCKRCSRVRRGKIEDRPKPSVMLVILVSGSLELLLDSWRSRENWARRWLVSRQGRALVRETEALSVVTFSSPLLLIAKVVTGLAGSKKTLFCP